MKTFANLSKMTILSAFLISCAAAPETTPPTSTGADVRLSAQMEGEYNLAASTAGPRRDYRQPIAPLGAGEWLYHQVNEGPNLAQITRQRVLNLRTQPDGRVLQTADLLTAPEHYQAMGRRLANLTLDQLTPEPGDGCDMVWIEMSNGWAGRVNPNDCRLNSEQGQAGRRFGARADIVGDRFRQADSTYDLDGNLLWGFEDGEWRVLYRADPPPA